LNTSELQKWKAKMKKPQALETKDDEYPHQQPGVTAESKS